MCFSSFEAFQVHLIGPAVAVNFTVNVFSEL
jgi:hypothetical protein